MVTYTTTYNLKKPTVADDEDVWGGYLNDSMDLIDDVLDGTTPVTGIDINSGTIDNAVIGGTTPVAGTFTTLTANTSLGVTGNITVSGTVDGVDIATRDGVLTTTTTTANAALPKAGGTMTGAITFATGQTFDGRDVSADGTKLDGIESGATADQTKADIDALGIAASTAATLATARNIALSGDVSGSASFDGSANISITATVANNSHTHTPSNITNLIEGTTFTGTYPVLFGIDETTGRIYENNSITFNGTTNTLATTAMDVSSNIQIGSEVVLQESTDRADLLQITSTTSSWGGLQIRNSSNEGRWSFMTDGNVAGIYNDEGNQWHIYMTELGGVQLWHNQVAVLDTTSSGVDITGTLSTDTLTVANQLEMSNNLDMNNYDIYGVDQIFHHGDTNTYIQFHAADQFRVVTGGSERFEVNNTRTQADRLLVTAGLHERYQALSGTTPTCDVDLGGGFSLTMTGNTTFTFAAMAIGSGSTGGFVLELTGNGSTVTWPTSVDWAGGTAPDAPASGETDLYVFYTRNNGTTWYGVQSIDAAA